MMQTPDDKKGAGLQDEERESNRKNNGKRYPQISQMMQI